MLSLFFRSQLACFFFLVILINLPIVYLLVCLFCVCVGLVYATAYMWNSEDNVSKVFFPFNYLNPRN